jgi:hypothetical protein
MECQKKENLEMCACTSLSCARRGMCCECIQYHRRLKELPGCFFPEHAEATYNRKLKYFLEVWANKLGFDLVER